MGAKNGTLEERFWLKVDRKGADDCWPWLGYLHHGYGRISSGRFGEPVLTASRVSWGLHNGAIPPGLHVLHTCDNRACVNPAHLWLGTNDDNIADMLRKRRNARGERMGSAKLRPEQVIAIRQSSGASRKIAAQYGVSSRCILQIRRGVSWRHLSASSAD